MWHVIILMNPYCELGWYTALQLRQHSMYIKNTGAFGQAQGKWFGKEEKQFCIPVDSLANSAILADNI